MTTINNKQNLDAHYSNNTKIKRKPMVVTPPVETIPEVKLWNDEQANIRIKALNKDLYERTKTKKNFFWA